MMCIDVADNTQEARAYRTLRAFPRFKKVSRSMTTPYFSGSAVEIISMKRGKVIVAPSGVTMGAYEGGGA